VRNSGLENKIFTINTQSDFDECAIDVFQFQYENNSVYRNYVNALGRKPSSIKEYIQIPFLPIQFFKSHKVICDNCVVEREFESSGTTSLNTSRHFVASIELYEKSYMAAFKKEYGEPSDYIILALLPSYIERNNSSLINMVQGLIKESKNKQSGFFLNNHKELVSIINANQNHKILLIGVSFALLDLVEQFSICHQNITVMETGGMKGRRKEITRGELHETISKSFNNAIVHSEYGMTELLSQAYSKSNGVFVSPNWMKVLIRDMYDPFSYMESQKLGGINVIDLANLYSCSFVETQDLGKSFSNNTFSVEGRFDSSQIRGCNLMVE